jgi:hypothetical protein
MADVFISFIHEEEMIAKALQKFLCEVLPSTKVFLSADTWQVYAGEIWLDRISDELRQSKIVLLLLSPQSVVRPWVNFEAGGAWFLDKKVIPICFHGLIKDKLPKPYSNIQAVGISDCNDQHYLVTSVTHYLRNQLPPLPPTGKKVEPYKNLSQELERFEELNIKVDQ